MTASALNLAISLLISAGYCLASVCCGHAVLRACGRITMIPVRSRLARLIIAFLLGLCVFAVLWLALALPGWLSVPAVTGVLLASCVLGFGSAWHDMTGLRGPAAEHFRWWQSQNSGFKFATALALTLIALLAIGALIKPPIGDAEAFYMAYSAIIADSERLVPMPGLYSSFSQIGLFGEFHFAALILLADVAAAKFLLWPLAMVSALLLALIGIAAGLQRRGTWYAVIILFTSTTFTYYITDGKVELFAAALGLAAYYCALASGPGATQRTALALAGLFAGFACVAKITYLAAFLPPLYLLVAWRQWCAHTTGATACQRLCSVTVTIAQLAFWTGLAWVPHLVKNALLFNAPFAPFFGVSDGGIIDQTWFSEEVTRRIIATYPFALAFGRYPMQGGNLSFLLLALLPLALLLPHARPLLHSTLAQLAIAALIGTVIWMVARPSLIAPRYLLATLLLLVPLAARAAEAAEVRTGWLRLGILATIMIALAIFIHPHRKMPWELIKHVMGNSSPCKLASPYCAPLMDLNHRAAAGDRVFFAGYYGFWLRPDLLQCRDGRDELKLIETAGESAWSALIERGFRFVAVEPDSHGRALERLTAAEPPAWLTVTTLYEKPVLVIYEITVPAPFRQPLAQCRQVTPPAWDVVSLR